MFKNLYELLNFYKINYKKFYFLAAFSATFEIAAYGLAGLIISNFNNSKINTINIYDLISIEFKYLPIILILFFLFKTVIQISNIYLITRDAWELRTRISSQLIKKYVLIDYLKLIKIQTGDLINTIAVECTRSANFIKQYFEMISKFILSIILLIFMINYNFKYSIILIIINLFLVSIFLKRILNFSKRIGSSRLSVTQNHTLKITNIINSIVEAKIWKFEDRLNDDYKKIGSEFSGINQKNAFYPSLVVPLVEFLIIFSVSIIFLYFFFYGDLKTELIVEFIILLIITLRIFQASAGIITSLMRAKSLYPSISFLLNEIKYENNQNLNLEYKKDINESIDELSINSITYGYEKDNKIFENASINFKKNTVNVIIAKSGEGKTTFFNILAGLIKIDQGEILINKTLNLSELNKENYLSKIAYVSQSPYMLNDTIENNININLEKINFEKFKKATKLSLVEDFISRENLNYQTILDEDGRNFSQGQIQRISLARAIYRSPDVYLFDESTSALDEENQKKIIENIKLTKENSIVIVVSHRLEILKIADNIYEIKDKQFNKIDVKKKFN